MTDETIDVFDWIKSRIPNDTVRLLLALAAAFSLFGDLEDFVNFAKLIANWTEYWGEFWAWLANYPLEYFDMYLTRHAANSISAMILYLTVFTRTLFIYKPNHGRKIKNIHIIIGVLIVMFSLSIFGYQFFKIDSVHEIESAGFVLLIIFSVFSIAAIFLYVSFYKKYKSESGILSIFKINDVDLDYYRYTFYEFYLIGIALIFVFAVNLAVAIYENAPPFPE